MRIDNVPIVGDENSKSKAAKQRLDETTSNFMKMLTTQLQNQDPTDPMDHETLTTQIVGFINLEQVISSNEHLEKLVSLSEHSVIGQGIPYIGAEVGAEATFMKAPLELKDGKAHFDYNQTKKSETTEIRIYDASGNIVHTSMAKDTREGPHAFIWNGLSNDHKKLPDGKYFIEVEAVDNNDVRVPVKSTVIGLVNSATKKGGKLYLMSGGREFEASEINYIRYPDQEVNNKPTSLVDIFG